MITQRATAILASIGFLSTSIGILMASSVCTAEARVLATSTAGHTLSADAATAFAEALQFSHDQIGAPRLNEEQLSEVLVLLVRAFPTLPVEQQVGLSNVRASWSRYRGAWGRLDLEQQRGFVYEVLAFAYGDEAASDAVYGSSSGGAQYVHSSGDGTIASDGECTYASIPGMSISTCD